MAALTAPQLELLRRLGAGHTLYDCRDIPRFLDEVILLSRLGLVTIGNDGSPTVTVKGAAYQRVAEELSSFGPRSDLTPMESSLSLLLVATPDSPFAQA